MRRLTYTRNKYVRLPRSALGQSIPAGPGTRNNLAEPGPQPTEREAAADRLHPGGVLGLVLSEAGVARGRRLTLPLVSRSSSRNRCS